MIVSARRSLHMVADLLARVYQNRQREKAHARGRGARICAEAGWPTEEDIESVHRLEWVPTAEPAPTAAPPAQPAQPAPPVQAAQADADTEVRCCGAVVLWCCGTGVLNQS